MRPFLQAGNALLPRKVFLALHGKRLPSLRHVLQHRSLIGIAGALRQLPAFRGMVVVFGDLSQCRIPRAPGT